VNSGPMLVKSEGLNVGNLAPLIMSVLRYVHTVNGAPSFTEIMGYPVVQLDTECWFPAYNNVDMSTQLRMEMH
jgi:hypothetical protein